MALDVSSIKEELANLREKKASIERKIQGLEHYLGVRKSNGKTASPSGISVRGGVNIRPTVEDIFTNNNNEPVRVKNIVDMVAQKHPDVDRQVIERKLIHVKRTILEQVEYGKYRLKEQKNA